jgi:hypothetical protein
MSVGRAPFFGEFSAQWGAGFYAVTQSRESFPWGSELHNIFGQTDSTE